MTEANDPAALLHELSGEAADVDVVRSGESDAFVRDGVVFAAHSKDNAVELCLGLDISDAARRTPDTGVSDRGQGWVRFAPQVWDEHALDRLEAWFRVAWRMAGGKGR